MTIRIGKLYFYLYYTRTFLACALFISALAVFVRSPAAYEALKSFNILQLPSRATLQAYTGAFLDSPGMFIVVYIVLMSHDAPHYR